MDQRRKRVSLTIFQKVEILKKLQHGSSVKMIQEEYNVGKSTIYDLRSDKEKILQYAAECESANLMKNRKTMKPAKFDELDRVLYEWFKQRRSEGIPISGFILREKAREFHQTMDLEECQFSDGWLKNFRKRYDIKYLKVSGEKNSVDTEAAENYVEVFNKMVMEDKLLPSQIYNADETGLLWRCIPRIPLQPIKKATFPVGKKVKSV